MRSVRNILACLMLAASLAGCGYESDYDHRYGGGYAYGRSGYYGGGGYHPHHYNHW